MSITIHPHLLNKITIFRSGVSNVADYIGYHLHRQSKGYTLANVGPNKYPKLYACLIQDLKLGIPTFLDNGIVTALRKGRPIHPRNVLEQYRVMVDTLPSKYLKHLYIVIPDNPFCSKSAVSIVSQYSEEIRYLARMTNCIVPMHRYPHETNTSIESITQEIMSELKYARVVLGVPCRASIKDFDTGQVIKPRLNSQELNALLKIEVGNRYVFKEMHCLGMSEKTRGNLLIQRLLLAEKFNVKFSMDACRTSALFVSETPKRKAAAGTKLINQLEPLLERRNIEHSAVYRDYGINEEAEEPVLYDKAMDLIDEDPVRFTSLYNSYECSPMKIFHRFDSELEHKQYLMNMIETYPSELELIDILKKMFINEVFHSETRSDLSESRIEAISSLTAIDGIHSGRQGVQLPLL
jgi:hypothetical protein